MTRAILIISPPILTWDKNTFKFLRKIDEAFKRKQYILLDLSTVTEAYADILLILMAKVHSLRWRSKRNVFQMIYYPNESNNQAGFNALVRTGFQQALNAKSETDFILLAKNNNYFQTGYHKIQSDMLITTQNVLNQTHLPDAPKHYLQIAINEALLNIHNHAYIGNTYWQRVLKQGRWWQCIWFDQKNHRLVFIIYDIGHGMVQTYRPESEPNEDILLELMKKGYSRYNQVHSVKRGKGTDDFKQVLQHWLKRETLMITTNGLRYLARYNGAEINERCFPYIQHESLQGTLLCWELSLKENENDTYS